MPPRRAAALCPYARGVRFDAPAANSRRRLVPALAVLAAHALLLALWLQTRGPLPPPAAEAVAWLRLVEPAAPTASGAAPAPLDLTLPRQPHAPWRERNPALDDPRSNTRPPAAVEARIAAALGDGRWQVERLDHDRVRYRSGGRCIIAPRSRAGQIELAGGAFRDLWAVSDC